MVNSYQGQLAAAGRDAALKRIEILDPNKPFDAEALVPSWRHKIESAELKDEQYKKALAGELKALVCSGDGDSIYIVCGLTRNDTETVIASTGAQAPSLVTAILDKDCPVSAALTAGGLGKVGISYKTVNENPGIY